VLELTWSGTQIREGDTRGGDGGGVTGGVSWQISGGGSSGTPRVKIRVGARSSGVQRRSGGDGGLAVSDEAGKALSSDGLDEGGVARVVEK
jgi:hypothetical protein